MKILAFGFLIFGVAMSQAADSLYQQTVTTIEGKKMSLSDYKGKPLMVVNIATQCGYTPQLSGLEKLYQKYKAKGFVVVGVPSNDFGGQTPEADKDVKKFCQVHHGVTFPLTSKASVLGDKKSPLISWLLKEGPSAKDIAWNFEKFLINKEGKVVQRFGSSTAPDDAALVSAVEKTL